MRLNRSPWTIDTRAEELVEHIVFIRCQNQLGNRQAHLACDVARADIAEVARRHTERDLLVVVLRRQEITLEVIHDLGCNTAPVDRIHGADTVLGLESRIVRYRFNNILRIIKHTAHSQVIDVRVL